MSLQISQEKRMPYLIAIIGIAISIVISCFLFFYIDFYIDSLLLFKAYIPILVLILGLSLTVLICAMLCMAQVAKTRTITLNQMNENLKKESADRMSVEEVKQKLEIALLQGQKLQAMGTLAGGIAHDFNNILYAITGYTELSRQDVPQDSLTYVNLGKILEASHRGQELIARILAFSRRQQHYFKPIHIKSTIEAALALLRPTIPASVIVHFSTKLDPVILGNQTQIHQVLVNLINNAVDAMDGEGDITIKLTQIASDDPFLKQFPETMNQNYCKIEITDTGHGMDQHIMERIFEPFFTTKEVGKGTGLGLSIVHSIIKEHQGDIIVQSKLGRGTTFVILLPECAAT